MNIILPTARHSLFPNAKFVILLSATLLGISCILSFPLRGNPGNASNQPEPNYETAALWWPPQENVWTPIGWKNHAFRFNVLYNGSVIARPQLPLTGDDGKWYGKDFQLVITPSREGVPPKKQPESPYQLCDTPDRGIGNQGWADREAPLLWTEWRDSESGVSMREEIFAHIHGARDVQSGLEPIYAWIRLSVHHVNSLKATERVYFVLGLGSDNIRRHMEDEINLTVIPEQAAYKGALSRTSFTENGETGCFILEEDGTCRLAALPSTIAGFEFKDVSASSEPGKPSPGIKHFLIVSLPALQGASVDLLLPIVSSQIPEIRKEISLGFDGALAECERYWSNTPESASKIITPEKAVNQAIKRSIQFSELVALKIPGSEYYSFLSGSWHYERLWATPTSMVSHMMLDNLGYHEVVEKHLKFYKEFQGTVVPPGPSYSLHRGYFSTPKILTSIDWLADNGAVLYELAKHALTTDDREFIDVWLDPILASCEFIRDARAMTGHTGVNGALPPAIATDRRVPSQSIWSIGWNYKGLITAVRLLKRISHPRAAEFEREAEDYKNTYLKTLKESIARAPQWADAGGRKHDFIPISLSEGGDDTHAFYLDTGPLFLVWSELLHAADPLMNSTREFFRHGPNTLLHDPQGNCWQRPILIHEISSCEPCYSWNIYHSWQLGDRYRFLEGMYSLLAGALSRQTYISCETRHGIYGTVFASPLFTDLVKLAVIDDVLEANRLHLLRIVPAAWIREDFETRFENVATEYGPVSIAFRLYEGGTVLKISYNADFHHPPEGITLHVPPVPSINRVNVNGTGFDAKAGILPY